MAIVRFVTAAAWSVVLCACSMQQTPALPAGAAQNTAPVVRSTPTATASPAATEPAASDTACAGAAEVTVSTCRIEFTSVATAPVTITVTRSADTNAAIAEHDDCDTAGAAKISQISADQWTVGAGSRNGTCELRFSLANSDSEAAAIVSVQKTAR